MINLCAEKISSILRCFSFRSFNNFLVQSLYTRKGSRIVCAKPPGLDPSYEKGGGAPMSIFQNNSVLHYTPPKVLHYAPLNPLLIASV